MPVTGPIPVKCIFNEVVVGFGLAGVAVVGATAGQFVVVSTTQYTFQITTLFSSGDIQVAVLAGVTHDQTSNANANARAVPLSMRYDSDPPQLCW